MVVACGFFTFVLLQVNDVGVLEVSGNITSLPEELEQADNLLSKCLTTHWKISGGIPSGPGALPVCSCPIALAVSACVGGPSRV